MALRSVTCYPVPGKRKSSDICDAFLEGWRTTAEQDPRRHSFFFGVTEGNRRAFDAARRNPNADWYYGDNSFFDSAREKYFRVSKNCFQEYRRFAPDAARFAKLGVRVAPWRGGKGGHIVVVEQSADFMELRGEQGWLAWVVAEVRKHTDRELRIRHWDRDKAKLVRSLPQDLEGAWALVTHSSAAAVTAALAGIPVYATSACAVQPIAQSGLSAIEHPREPEAVREWAAGLASRQWTLEEFRNGMAWEALHNE